MNKRFKIWKASIESYRILDTQTNEVIVLDSFYAIMAEFKVDLNKYNEAKEKNFANSGDEFDYFAWIETDIVIPKEDEAMLGNAVWYNLFLHTHFRVRETLDIISKVDVLYVVGNKLSYKNY